MNLILTPPHGRAAPARLQNLNERAVVSFGICAFLLILGVSIAGRLYLELYLSPANAKLTSSKPKERALVKGDILVPVTLSLKLVDGKAVLRGMLPNESAHQTVLARAGEIYGHDIIEDNLVVQPGIMVTPWFDSVLKWFPPRVDQLRAGEISVSGMNVLIFGRVPDVESRLSAGRKLAQLVGAEGQFINELQVSLLEDPQNAAATQSSTTNASANHSKGQVKTTGLRMQF